LIGLPLVAALLQAAPTLLGPGVISTAAPEFAASFSPDGTSLFFNRASDDRSRMSILVSRFEDGTFREASVAPFSGVHRDVDPFVSPDGERLYFSSSRPTAAADTTPDFNTWYVRKEGSGWSEPIVLPEPLNTASQEAFVSVDREGTLYFASDRDGTQRIWRSRLPNGAHEPPEVVAFEMNRASGGSNPWISSLGRLLVFVGSRPGGADSDLYYACLGESGWLPAENLGRAVNSDYADFAPSLTPDGLSMVFTSERPGIVPASPEGVRPPGDLYRIDLASLKLSCR
jgi:Tol biopolymer transport system component